ncbi:ImmA/IrrE family metallo-endopeptidase [Nesterenkonia lacusekhoensis]|uniref:ImmA/IrrE family metallo-endopeptidase n=1 Tax=Nesterenkonia lacusekhoensis TaxID=150832 RepID=UPI001AE944FB
MGTLIDYLEALGVKVLHQAPEAQRRWAEWCSRSKTIRIRPDLGAAQYAYALAHEAGHAFHGHSCSWSRWEWEADVFAATWLIRPCEWAAAVKIHETVQGVAHELGVIPHLVRVYHSI